jgi:hypothetical protein
MLKTSLAAAVVAASLAFAGGAALAQTYPQPNTPVATPLSQAHQQAQLANNPAACGPAAEQLWNNPALHIEQQSPGTTRMVARELLRAAKNFAAAGNDALCWHWYDRYQQAR